jgi:hypothetical protein
MNLNHHLPVASRLQRVLLATLVAGALCGAGGPAQAIGSLADIQIYDRKQNRYLPVHWHEGRAYVVGEPGNEYQIRVANRLGGDVMTVVSIDGVNVVTGETASPEQSGYVFSRRQQYDIKGWRKSLDRTAAFYFTHLSDSYAARTGRPDNVGVIGVAVFRRKPADPLPAISRDDRRWWGPQSSGAGSSRNQASEKSAAAGQLSPDVAETRPAAPALGTGHGRSETSVVRNVAFERATAAPEEVITLYYDSRRNLMARGILPTPQGPLAVPQPFPGRFVSDPS